ncbi:Chromatin-associated protein [Komagataella phaffii CBS 7435]|uniref:Uncharacterized protein n=2 Tax=Komagataella phaffii TaxID=460519 RepID=C4R7I4_KOMPG|nr:uncharacterized protein PAS_chr4_0946 [Komagataella phaffii GS115]CAH2451067.1 Chromatin-associated protein [Komagataella phaffii CBS 7435]CAY71559.1 hypothetical protein PAS_chr4_0946 [Komagataella phaffii GS115]CCA40835.1 Chromatin-associated protein [Komagataella phaffii CBS 7435]
MSDQFGSSYVDPREYHSEGEEYEINSDQDDLKSNEIDGNYNQNESKTSEMVGYFDQQRKILELEKKLKEKEKERTKIGVFAQRVATRDELKREQEQTLENVMKQRTYTFDSGELSIQKRETNEKEKFTGLYINVRYLDKGAVNAMMVDKKILRIEKLLAKVYPPLYQPPLYPNWVVVGLIIRKNETKLTMNKTSNYKKMTISNFSQSVDLMLFGKALQKYWKLQVGAVIAVLNPGIWKYNFKSADNIMHQGFNLTLKDNHDSILEIGKSRDLGFCSSLKRDGNVCQTPINIQKSKHCTYHTELAMKKSTSKRLELSSAFRMRYPGESNEETNAHQHVYMKKGGRQLQGFLQSDPLSERELNKKELAARKQFSDSLSQKAFMEENFKRTNVNKAELKSKKERQLFKELEMRRSFVEKGATFFKDEEIETNAEKAEKIRLSKAAFSSGAVNKIGFNPTQRLFSKSNNLGIKAKAATNLKDFLHESETKEKHLNLSKHDIKKRRKKALEVVRRFQKPNGAANVEADSVCGKIPTEVTLPDSDSDSDF